MSDPEHLKEEKPYCRAYRRAREHYHKYTEHYRATIQSIGHHYRAKRQKYGGWEQEKKIIEVMAVVFIFIYTAIQGCQLSVIRDQERRQLRAYIGFEDIKLYCSQCGTPSYNTTAQMRPDHPFDNLITIYIHNGGQTPAYNVHCQGTFHDVPINQVLSQGFGYPEPRDTTIALGSGTFNPGHKEPAGIALDGPLMAMMISAKDKKISLFYYGHCDYEDVFDAQRSSPFCFQYLPDFNPPDKPDSPFINCPEHNTPDKGK